MKSPHAHCLLSAALIAVLLSPVAWTKQICADDWADETSPVDDPGTPAPDLYANKRYEDGVQSMPDLIQSTPAPNVVEVLPVGYSSSSAEGAPPGRVFFTRFISGTPRAPPALSGV